MSSPSGKVPTKSRSSAAAIAFSRSSSGMSVAEGDVLPQRQVEQNAVLKHEADLPVQRFFVIGVERFAIVGDGSGSRLQQPDEHVQQLRLSGGGGADDGGLRAALDRERNVLEGFLVAEGERNIADGEVAAKSRPQRAGFLGLRRHQNCAQAHVRSARLRHDVTHESQQDDGKDEQREITVERREISERHAAQDHEAAAQQKNDDGGQH